MLLLCADDFIHPDFVRRAVEIMEAYPNVGYVHGEKDFVREDGSVQYWDPFYKCSFVAPGWNAMPIYMMTTVAHPSQGVFRRRAFQEVGGYGREIDHMNADKALWFYLSWKNDAAYIHEKMCGIRIGGGTETSLTQRNFQHPVLCHLTIKDFVRFAREKDIPEVYNREGEALAKLADEDLSCGIQMMSLGSWQSAQAYLDYARILNRDICGSEKYRLAQDMLEKKQFSLERMARFAADPEKKKRGYEPPKGYLELKAGVDYGR